MSQHPNVTIIDNLTKALTTQDKDALSELVTEDLVFHLRGPYQPGDYDGVSGVLEVIGSMFEATNGDIRLEQQFCIGADGWAAEWEHAVLGRNGRTLESDNAFVYRIDGGRIAEMWMFIGVLPEQVGSFFD